MRKIKFVLLGFILLLSFVHFVQGDGLWWPGALNSGYAVTTDYHGLVVEWGTPVTAYAATTEPPYPEARYVVIRWLRPDGTEAWNSGLLPLVDSGNSWTDEKGNVLPIYWATDTRIPDVVGDWGVQAIFYESEQVDIEPPLNDKVAIRATSYFYVPEAPLGTITIILSMIAVLSLFTLRRRGFNIHPPSR